MKKLSLITLFASMVLSLQSCFVSKHPNMAFFDNPGYDYKGAQFTSINLPLFLVKPIVKKALREDGEVESEEIINMIKKISKVKVMTVQNGDQLMLKDFATYLTNNKYEDWMTVKTNGNLVNIQAKQTGDLIKKLMLTVHSDKELVFVDVTGLFSPEDVSKLINVAQKQDAVKLN